MDEVSALREHLSWLRARQAAAIHVRTTVLKTPTVSVEVDRMVSHHVQMMTTVHHYYEATHLLIEAVAIIPPLLRGWEFDNAVIMNRGCYWRASVRRKDTPAVIRHGLKLSKFAGIALTSLVFQIHIEELEQDIQHCHKNYVDALQ